MKFNSIGFLIFGIPPYFFCAVIGSVLAICTYMILLSSKGYDITRYMKILVASMIGLFIGAKLFGCLSGLYCALGMGESITVDTIVNTGIVFYGGLFGMLIIFYMCLKMSSDGIKNYSAMDILAVTIPLFHMISRVGCFLAGCCFGIQCKSFFSIFQTVIDQGAEVSAWRIPVQLVEALFNLGLFLYLLRILRKPMWREKHILLQYLMIYSSGRFLLEFIRGDTVRGVINGISFSQLISISIWLIVIINNKRKRRTINGNYFN